MACHNCEQLARWNFSPRRGATTIFGGSIMTRRSGIVSVCVQTSALAVVIACVSMVLLGLVLAHRRPSEQHRPRIIPTVKMHKAKATDLATSSSSVTIAPWAMSSNVVTLLLKVHRCMVLLVASAQYVPQTGHLYPRISSLLLELTPAAFWMKIAKFWAELVGVESLEDVAPTRLTSKLVALPTTHIQLIHALLSHNVHTCACHGHDLSQRLQLTTGH